MVYIFLVAKQKASTTCRNMILPPRPAPCRRELVSNPRERRQRRGGISDDFQIHIWGFNHQLICTSIEYIVIVIDIDIYIYSYIYSSLIGSIWNCVCHHISHFNWSCFPCGQTYSTSRNSLGALDIVL